MSDPNSRPLVPLPLSEPPGGLDAAEGPGLSLGSAAQTGRHGEAAQPRGGAGLEPDQQSRDRIAAEAAISVDGLLATDRPSPSISPSPADPSTPAASPSTTAASAADSSVLAATLGAPAADGAVLPPPPAPPAAPPGEATENDDDAFPGEVEMTLVDHLEELRRRLLRSLLALLIAAAACLLAVKPLVRLLEVPASGIRFLQLAPGEFLFVSLKVAGYAGLTLALPWILFEALAFVLPGLTRRERRLVAPAVAGSTLLFLAGLAFAWWALVPAALRFLVSYGADVVEPLWSIERYLDFVLLLMVATALAFQLPVLQLLLGALGILDAATMLAGWRWVVLVSAVAGAVLTPSTDPVTMLLLSGAITALYLIGVGLVALVGRPRLDRA
jgi:sec-independent protein translocase protein TatC